MPIVDIHAKFEAPYAIATRSTIYLHFSLTRSQSSQHGLSSSLSVKLQQQEHLQRVQQLEVQQYRYLRKCIEHHQSMMVLLHKTGTVCDWINI